MSEIGAIYNDDGKRVARYVWPKKTPTQDPSACRWCGLSKEGHMSQWHAEAGWHTWAEPTTEQRYAAIRANAAARRAPDSEMDEFEAADEMYRRWE